MHEEGHFLEVGPVEGFVDGAMVGVEIGEHEMLIVRRGEEFLISDLHCPHMGGVLAEGSLDGMIVTCPRHGSQFDLTTGQVIRWTHFEGAVLGAAKLLRHPRPLRVYEAKVDGGVLWVGPQKEPPPLNENL